jgi:hypothetical protein
MSHLDRLPDEILDIIYNYYWSDYFKHNVLNEISLNMEVLLSIDNFITNKLINLLMCTNDCKIPVFMLYINNYFSNLKQNKGIVLLLKINFPNHPIKYIFNDHSHINLPDWCKYIGIYSISKSGIMRYYIHNTINKLEKPTF